MHIVQNLSTLRNISTIVESVEEAQKILKQLEDTLYTWESGVGLAAIQIDIPKRVALVKTKNEKFALINPEVITLEDEIIFPNDGCLSIPGINISTKRFQTIIIKNQVIEENKFREETQYFYYDPGKEDITSIIVQHEIDHMNGILFIDRKIEKIGRNEPCPCGSGKKYKKCCLKE